MSEQRTKSSVDGWLYVCIGIPAIFFGSLTICLLAGIIIASIVWFIIARYVLDLLPAAWNPERIEFVVFVVTDVVAVVGAFVFAVRMTKRISKSGWPNKRANAMQRSASK